LQRFRRRDFPAVPIPTFFPSLSRVRTDQFGEQSLRLMWAGSTTSPGSRWVYQLHNERSGQASTRIYPVAITASEAPGNAAPPRPESWRLTMGGGTELRRGLVLAGSEAALALAADAGRLVLLELNQPCFLGRPWGKCLEPRNASNSRAWAVGPPVNYGKSQPITAATGRPIRIFQEQKDV